MKISIIIPVYNVEAYIVECLESVAQQTYTGEMECLIVDDCGTDNSIPLAQDFIDSYQGKMEFRILHHKKNRGLSAARNTGTNAATGDYIYYLDSDDVIIPETIELMARIVQDHPQVEMVQGGMGDMDGGIISDFTNLQLPEYTDDLLWISTNIFLYLPVSSCNRLQRKEFLLKENITFHEGIIHEDVPYNFLLAIKCRHIGFVRKNTYIVRKHRMGSITNTPQEQFALQSRLMIMHDNIDAYLSCMFESKKLQLVALNALWEKWLYYMMIHRKETLSCFTYEISKISEQMSSITPYPQKLVARCYHSLPFKIRGNKKIIRIVSFLMFC